MISSRRSSRLASTTRPSSDRPAGGRNTNGSSVAPEAGGATDEPFVFLPPAGRSEEGLVVEASRDERRDEIIGAAKIEADRGGAVLAGGDQAVAELGHGGARVGDAALPQSQLQERVRLLGASRINAARPVILEAAANQMDAVGDERRGEGVAGVTLIGDAVEDEVPGLAAVDAA